MIFLLYLFIPIGIDPVETNSMRPQWDLGLVRFYGIQSGRNNRYINKFVIETRIHSGLRFNLLIVIGRTRDRLLTSESIPSLMVCLS
jgi:hypothetical protein